MLMGKKVQVCDAILSNAGNVWYYIKVGSHYGFIHSERVVGIPVMALRVVDYLDAVHEYVKDHYKYFINDYNGEITTFADAKSRVKSKRKVGITCVVPLRFALHYFGIKNGNGKSLISAPDGSFEKYYTGDVKKKMTRITKGKPIGMNIVQAIDDGLLIDGDIVCYKGITHTSVFSGNGYKFYEGGGACVKDGHYPNGILLDYSKNFYKDKKIAEILRWKE